MTDEGGGVGKHGRKANGYGTFTFATVLNRELSQRFRESLPHRGRQLKVAPARDTRICDMITPLLPLLPKIPHPIYTHNPSPALVLYLNIEAISSQVFQRAVHLVHVIVQQQLRILRRQRRSVHGCRYLVLGPYGAPHTHLIKKTERSNG